MATAVPLELANPPSQSERGLDTSKLHCIGRLRVRTPKIPPVDEIKRSVWRSTLPTGTPRLHMDKGVREGGYRTIGIVIA